MWAQAVWIRALHNRTVQLEPTGERPNETDPEQHAWEWCTTGQPVVTPGSAGSKGEVHTAHAAAFTNLSRMKHSVVQLQRTDSDLGVSQ